MMKRHFPEIGLGHLAMPKRRSTIAIPSLKAIDRPGHVGRQLAQALRDAIARGELKPGERLPSTRMLAASPGIARGTVVKAFDQLAAEGYLAAKVGAGTRAAAALVGAPPAAPAAPARGPAAVNDLDLPPSVARLAAVAHALAPQPPVPFAIAVPTAGIATDDQ